MKILSIFSVFSLFILLSACTQKTPKSTKIEKDQIDEIGNIDNANEFIAEIDSPIIEDETTIYYPKTDDKYPLSVLYLGVYHNEEIPPEFVENIWYGVFRNKRGCYLAATSILITPVYDPVSDDEDDPSSWTGWNVEDVSGDTAVFLIGNLQNFQIKDPIIETVLDEEISIPLLKSYSFLFRGNEYTLLAEGDMARSEVNSDEVVYSNYSLYLLGKKNGNLVKQLLCSTPYFDDTIFKIEFIGDIDNDGIPDLLINTTKHYNVQRPTLYLSSFAKEDQLVEVVALHYSVGC